MLTWILLCKLPAPGYLLKQLLLIGTFGDILIHKENLRYNLTCMLNG